MSDTVHYTATHCPAPQVLTFVERRLARCLEPKKRGWALATRSYRRTRWALSLSRAVCFPTPLSAACGRFGLMAGPFRPLPAGICRVRLLRLVRSPPAGDHTPDAVRTCLQNLFTSSPLSRGRHRFLTGCWPRVTGLTSYLAGCILFCREVTCFFTSPPSRRLTNFARFVHSPLAHRCCVSGW